MDIQERHAIETMCQRLIVQLTHCVDHHLPEQAADLFSEDGIWIRGGKTYRGRDEIISSFAGADSIHIRHVVSNISIDALGPASANGSSYYILFRHDTDAGQVQFPMPMQLPFSMGEWHDTFVLEEGRWLFASRDVKRLFQRADP